MTSALHDFEMIVTQTAKPCPSGVIYETGTVCAIDGATLWVETVRDSVCARCAVRHGCGQGLRQALRTAGSPPRPYRDERPDQSSGGRFVIPIACDPNRVVEFFIGQQVRVGVPERALLGGALIVYMMPLLLAMLGATLAHLFGGGETEAIAGAGLGLVSGFWAVRRHARAVDDDINWRLSVYPSEQ